MTRGGRGRRVAQISLGAGSPQPLGNRILSDIYGSMIPPLSLQDFVDRHPRLFVLTEAEPKRSPWDALVQELQA